MDLSASTWWWVICGVLIAAELSSGTFYLVMLALGAAAGAIAAHVGVDHNGQVVAGALVGGGATLAWYLHRRKAALRESEQPNRDMNLDIGESVTVETWTDDRSTQVRYRGATWSARFDGTGEPQPGPHRISGIDGSRLLLTRPKH